MTVGAAALIRCTTDCIKHGCSFQMWKVKQSQTFHWGCILFIGQQWVTQKDWLCGFLLEYGPQFSCSVTQDCISSTSRFQSNQIQHNLYFINYAPHQNQAAGVLTSGCQNLNKRLRLCNLTSQANIVTAICVFYICSLWCPLFSNCSLLFVRYPKTRKDTKLYFSVTKHLQIWLFALLTYLFLIFYKREILNLSTYEYCSYKLHNDWMLLKSTWCTGV